MAYRRRRLTYRSTVTGRLRTSIKRRRSPKHGSRYSSGFLGRAFNLNWLYGTNRYRKTL